jgi:hypothetical protein
MARDVVAHRAGEPHGIADNTVRLRGEHGASGAVVVYVAATQNNRRTIPSANMGPRTRRS